MKEIYKIQRSISTNTSKAQVLIYNKDRSVYDQFDLDETIANLMGERFKVYVIGVLVKNILQINDEVSEQDW